MTLRLSYSSITEFQACPRKWFYNRLSGYKPLVGEARPLGFGNAFHAGQQAWWLGRHDDDAAARLGAAQAAFLERGRELSPEDQALGQILLTGYAARYADQGLMFHAEPIVEQRVWVPVQGPDGPAADMELVAVFDVVTYDLEGNTVVLEHKTTTSTLDDGSRFWGRFDLNLQVNLYYIIASDLGRTVGRFVLDAVRAPEMHRELATPPEQREFYKRDGKYGKVGDPRPGTRLADQTPDEFAAMVTDTVLGNPGAFYARRDLSPSPAELERTRADLYTVGRSMVHAVENDLYPRNLQSCYMFNRPCPYLPVCNGETSIENPRLYQVRPRPEFEK